MKYIKNILLVLLSAFLGGCYNQGQSTSQSYSSDYNKKEYHLHPEYLSNNINDEKTRVFLKLQSQELLYARNFEKDVMQSSLMLKYKLYSDADANNLIDTGSVTIIDEFANDSARKEEVIKTFELNTPAGQNCYLEITLTDINRKEEVKSYLSISKKSINAKQNFLVFSSETFAPLFRTYLLNNETVTITHRNADVKQLQVRYYKREYGVALPPFSVGTLPPFKYAADSSFTITANDKGTFYFSASTLGFYHFQIDSLDKEGLTLFKFRGVFPKCNTPDLMIFPLRYITSKPEFDELQKSANKKEALDKFWVGLAGSNDRGRELIKEYYNRVQNSNKYFTSYLEGWKTDRGMVYLIYGPPNNIYKNNNSETWVYGEENNFRSIQFNFIKINNPFTENDYGLSRNPIFKDNWYLAVDTWRQGRIFNSNN